jgi:hypothetical protein
MIAPNQPRCECDKQALPFLLAPDTYSEEERKSQGHRPGECPSTSLLRRYNRGGKALWLCSACRLNADVPLTGPVDD